MDRKDLNNLIARSFFGDAGAWAELFGAFVPILQEFISKRTRKLFSGRIEPDEVLSEVYSSAFDRLPTEGSVLEADQFPQWLFGIAAQTLRNEARDEQRWLSPIMDASPELFEKLLGQTPVWIDPHLAEPWQLAAESEDLFALFWAIRQLPQDQYLIAQTYDLRRRHVALLLPQIGQLHIPLLTGQKQREAPFHQSAERKVSRLRKLTVTNLASLMDRYRSRQEVSTRIRITFDESISADRVTQFLADLANGVAEFGRGPLRFAAHEVHA